MKLEIVAAQPEDAADIAFVHNLTWLDTYTKPGYVVEIDDVLSLKLDGEEKIKQRRRWLEEQGNEKRTFVAKLNGQKIIGFCAVKKLVESNDIQFF